MKLDTLDALQDTELQAVIARCNELLKQRDKQRKDEALEQARVTLAAVGLSLKDLNGRTKSKPSVVYHGGKQYQHPSNKALIWKGKGQKPGWLRELEAEGRRPVEIEPANDNIPPSLKKTG
jgi:DNA-binding protein H-NS